MRELLWRSPTDSAPPPKRIRLAVPGWGGDRDPTRPQPWNCKPFVDANTLGTELVWWRPDPLTVTGDGTKITIDGNNQLGPPNKYVVDQFADGYYGVAAGFALKLDPGWGGLVLPHPAFTCDPYNSTLPAVIPGLIEFAWWPRSFFIVVRCPPAGVRHEFRYGVPFAQILPVPLDLGQYGVRKMTQEESDESVAAEWLVVNNYEALSSRIWIDTNQQRFSDHYKRLSQRFAEGSQVDWNAVREEVTRPPPRPE